MYIVVKCSHCHQWVGANEEQQTTTCFNTYERPGHGNAKTCNKTLQIKKLKVYYRVRTPRELTAILQATYSQDGLPEFTKASEL